MFIKDYSTTLRQVASLTCQRIINHTLEKLALKGYMVVDAQLTSIDYQEHLLLVTDARTEEGYYLTFKVRTLNGDGWGCLHSYPYTNTPESSFYLVPESDSMASFYKLVNSIKEKRILNV